MDDPLRPKTVPLSAETILWFEFLLDPSLLTSHLAKANPDPSPIDLITQFIAMSPDHQIAQYDLTGPEIEQVAPPQAENFRLVRKQLALKVLTLKVATHLKWNLDVIERSLPVQKQIFLFRDLCTIAFGKPILIPLPLDFDQKVGPEGNAKAVKFALTLYHRWVLRTQILKELAIKAARPIMHIPMPPEPLNPIAPDIPVQPSVDYLNSLLQSTSNEPFYIFTYDSLPTVHANTDKIDQEFRNMPQISQAELRAQVYFDLTGFYLFSRQFELAQQSVIECHKNLQELKFEYSRKCLVNFLYCHVDEGELEGYMLACGVSKVPETLLSKFNFSVLNQYKDIDKILKLDNINREIPIVNRRIVELDIEGAIIHGQVKLPKDLEVNVSALNVIRGIFEADNVFNSVDYMKKYKTLEPFNAIVEGLTDLLPHCSLRDKNKIKEFVINQILVNKDNKKIIKQAETLGIFTTSELEDLRRQITDEEIMLPPLATHMDWKWSSKNQRIEIGAWERQLISCTNANTVRKVLVKLAPTNPSKPLWSINPSWQIPSPIKSLLMSFQRGFLQDFSYVLLGKSREMASRNDFVGAVSMLSVLKSELQRPELSSAAPVAKFAKLVNWEILFIQICQALEEWHSKPLDFNSLATRCKQCLNSLQNGDNIIPRIEIIEHCAMVLLNLNDWNALMFLDKRLASLELPIAFAATFLEMEKLKTSKKMPRDAWDIVLAMFSTSQQKRGGGNSRNSPSLVVSSSLYPFLKKIREPKVFSLAISLLAKIHNILKDDPNLDLNGDYVNLWPANISNPVGYNIRPVAETLNWLLTQALQFYPQNTNWLKIKGDLELAIGNNETAMKCYVNALVTGTEYFSLPLQRPIIDDYIIRKMIKCSSNLDCYMQAAVLCQFLDDIDYGLAFKNISEKSTSFSDAMDAYYGCIWDPTLLEFIVHLHNKKGEHNRKLEAISVMSNLELNANNNEEIKREAASIRKLKFLKALANQYLM